MTRCVVPWAFHHVVRTEVAACSVRLPALGAWQVLWDSRP